MLPWQVTMDQFNVHLSFPQPLLVWCGYVESTGILVLDSVECHNCKNWHSTEEAQRYSSNELSSREWPRTEESWIKNPWVIRRDRQHRGWWGWVAFLDTLHDFSPKVGTNDKQNKKILVSSTIKTLPAGWAKQKKSWDIWPLSESPCWDSWYECCNLSKRPWR